MKKAIDNKPARNNKRWTPEELKFLQSWYGKVKTDSLCEVFQKSAIALWQQCKKHGFKLNENIYSKEPVKVTFQGKVFELKAFQYARNENGSVKDMTIVRKKIGRPRKVIKHLNTEKQTVSFMAAHRRLPENKEKKPNLKSQTIELKEFVVPEGKKLTKVSPGLYKYL